MSNNKTWDKQYYIEHKKEIKEKSRQYYLDNKEKIKEYSKQHGKQYRQDHPEYYKQYYFVHKEELKEYKKQYHIDHKEKHNKDMKKYMKEQNHKENRNKNMSNRRKTDLKYNLNMRMRSLTNKTLKKNKGGRSWKDLVGYTCDDLIKRLKKTMPEGYTWQDVLDGKLHIDHIIPVSVHNYTQPEHTDFKRCWNLKNLQLLPAKENMKKNNKLYKPFQPALKI